MKASMLFMIWALLTQISFGAEEIKIPVGKERLLRLPSLAKSVELAQDNLLSVRKGENKASLLLLGKSAGATSMKVKTVSGTTLEYEVKIGTQAEAILEELKEVRSVKASHYQGKVRVTGSPQNKGDLQKLNDLKRRYPGMILDGTSHLLVQSSAVVNTVNRVLADNDMANLRAHSYGKIIVLEGSPKDPAQAAFALRIAQMIHPQIENHMATESSGAPAISIEVIFVEISKNNTLNVGIKHGLGEEAEGKGILSSQINPRTGTRKSGRYTINWQVGPLNSFLDLMQTWTASRVLSNPKLISRSGEEANFHVGRTVYMVHQVGAGEERESKIFPLEDGIKLQITPIIDSIGQIDAKITTSVSDFGESLDQASPAKSMAKIQTAVTIRDGETIMLSGLVKKNQNKTVERVPLLADIPILGELFKHRSHNDHDREMVILVTMNRVTSGKETLDEDLWAKGASDVEFSIFD